jgi:hypothetical protein
MWTQIKARAARFRSRWHRDVLTALELRQQELADRFSRLEERLAALRPEDPGPVPMVRPEESIPTPEQPATSPPPTPAPFGWTQEDRRRLEDQGLFVVGCGRSGTTILYETLNLSSEVYLLGEAFLYHQANRTDFVGFHDLRHSSYGSIRFKGLYTPRGGGPGENGFDLLKRLAERHRYVGEKLAFGPWMLGQPEEVEQFFAFHATHFFHSRYVVIVRDPREVVWSLAIKIPTVPVPTQLALWAVCLRIGLELAFTFPRVLVITHDRLDEEAASRLGTELGIDLTVPPGRFAREYQNTALGDGPLPAPLAEFRQPLTELAGLYHDLKAAFDPMTFRYAGRENPRAYASRLCKRASEIADRLLTGSHEAPRLTG